MKVLIIVLGFIGLGLGAPERRTPLLHPPVGGRIVGGVQADISQMPYQVVLIRNNTFPFIQPLCGGSLITPSIILTAAHCVESRVIRDISWLRVRAGSSWWRWGGQVTGVREIVLHELYDGDNSLDHDIALLHLEDSITDVNASVISLVDDGELFEAGTYGTVSGWGNTFAGSITPPEFLRKVDVPVVTEERCRIAYGSEITSNMICAGYEEGGRDACQGDSGGPYVINGRLAGIVSWGFGCATPLFPGVYASVAGLRSWIAEHAGV